MPPPFPWDAAMRIGLGIMKLSPAEFWNTTPRELDAAARALFGEVPGAPARNELVAMMSRYPDGGP